MLPAVLLALWSASTASGGEFAVRLLSTHDVRGTVAASRVCQQPCAGLGGCGGASKRQAAIANGRMNAADNTTGMLTDLVVIDGGTTPVSCMCVVALIRLVLHCSRFIRTLTSSWMRLIY